MIKYQIPSDKLILRPNILFIVIDSLRKDKCYGENKTSLTPHIDNLIQSGTCFDWAFSSVGSTGSSLASIFTSLFPFKTGMSSEKYQKLHSEAISFVSFLNDNDYHTYAASTPIASALGLIDNFKNKERHYHNYYSLFDGLGDEILSSFQSNYFQSPWFFYIHLNDLHQPIIVPESFKDEKFGDSNYDKMLSSIDHWIGKLLEKINLSETIVIITSDHGEYLGTISKEKNLNLESDEIEQFLWKTGNKLPVFMRPLKLKISNYLRAKRKKKKESKINELSLSTYERRLLLGSRLNKGHHMYDDILHVPLIFSGYNIKKQKISQLVRHVDIFPTLFEIINLKINHQIHGRSLVALMNNSLLDELPTYIESPPTIEQSRKKMIGLRTSNFKFIRQLTESPNPTIELYDLKNDPHEEYDISKTSPEIVKNYEKILQEIIKDSIDKNSFSEISDEHHDEIENELRKLGYL